MRANLHTIGMDAVFLAMWVMAFSIIPVHLWAQTPRPFSTPSNWQRGSFSSEEVRKDVGRTLQMRKFPWLAADLEIKTDLPLNEAGSARAKDRNRVRKRVERQTNFPPANTTPSPSASTFTGWNGLIDFQFLLWLIVAVAAIALVGGLFWLNLNRRRTSSNSSGSPAASPNYAGRIEQLPFEMDSENTDFRSRASKAAEQGDLREAIVFLFSYLLLRMDQGQWVNLRKGKTNRQYLAELNPYQPAEQVFERAMDTFERAFFGSHSIQRGEFDSCWKDLESFEQALPELEKVATQS